MSGPSLCLELMYVVAVSFTERCSDGNHREAHRQTDREARVSQRTRWSKREHTRTNHPIFTILCSIGSDQVGGAFGRYVDAEEPASSSDGGGSAAAIVHQSINPRRGESVSVRNARARMCVCVCGLGRYVSRYHRFLFLGSLKSDSSTDVMVWNDTSPSTSCSHQTRNTQTHTPRRKPT